MTFAGNSSLGLWKRANMHTRDENSVTHVHVGIYFAGTGGIGTFRDADVFGVAIAF
jgi:hypothetical protein